MIIKNATKDEIYLALNKVNDTFENNVRFNGFDTIGQGGTRFNVTLKVESSKGEGMTRGFSGRRTVFACWHVHGVFIDSLPFGTKVYSSPFNKWVKPGDAWNDKNIGSIAMPKRYSDACDCFNCLDWHHG